jgi:hypothetical protein
MYTFSTIPKDERKQFIEDQLKSLRMLEDDDVRQLVLQAQFILSPEAISNPSDFLWGQQDKSRLVQFWSSWVNNVAALGNAWGHTAWGYLESYFRGPVSRTSVVVRITMPGISTPCENDLVDVSYEVILPRQVVKLLYKLRPDFSVFLQQLAGQNPYEVSQFLDQGWDSVQIAGAPLLENAVGLGAWLANPNTDCIRHFFATHPDREEALLMWVANCDADGNVDRTIMLEIEHVYEKDQVLKHPTPPLRPKRPAPDASHFPPLDASDAKRQKIVD